MKQQLHQLESPLTQGGAFTEVIGPFWEKGQVSNTVIHIKACPTCPHQDMLWLAYATINGCAEKRVIGESDLGWKQGEAKISRGWGQEMTPFHHFCAVFEGCGSAGWETSFSVPELPGFHSYQNFVLGGRNPLLTCVFFLLVTTWDCYKNVTHCLFLLNRGTGGLGCLEQILAVTTWMHAAPVIIT